MGMIGNAAGKKHKWYRLAGKEGVFRRTISDEEAAELKAKGIPASNLATLTTKEGATVQVEQYRNAEGVVNGVFVQKDKDFDIERLCLRIDDGVEPVWLQMPIQSEQNSSATTAKVIGSLLAVLESGQMNGPIRFGLTHSPVGTERKDKEGKLLEPSKFASTMVWVTPLQDKDGKVIEKPSYAKWGEIPEPTTVKVGAKEVKDHTPRLEWMRASVAKLEAAMPKFGTEAKVTHAEEAKVSAEAQPQDESFSDDIPF